MTNEPDVTDDVENTGQLTGSEHLSIPLMKILLFSSLIGDNYVFETSLKLDSCHFKSEFACSNFSWIYPSL